MLEYRQILLDKKYVDILIKKQNEQVSSDINIIITSRNINFQSYQMTSQLVESILKYTKQEFNLWIIDNNGKKEYLENFLKFKNINLISIRSKLVWKRFKLNFLRFKKYKIDSGSYNNAAMLEVASIFIDNNTKYFLSLHNDIIISSSNWLEFLMEKISEKNSVVGIMRDKLRVNAIHQSGLLFDYQLFKKLKLDFWPQFYPLSVSKVKYDVGDKITTEFKKKGLNSFFCNNTYNFDIDDSLIKNNIFQNIYVDKILNNNNELIMAHQGRGYMKSINNYTRNKNKISVKQWNQICKNFLNEDNIDRS